MLKLRRIRPLDIHQRFIRLDNPVRDETVHLPQISGPIPIARVCYLHRQDTSPRSVVRDSDGRTPGCQSSPEWSCADAWPRQGGGSLSVGRCDSARSRRCPPDPVRMSAATEEKLTSSRRVPRPVVPNVSMANTSPSSILVWSEFFTNGMDLPPWMRYCLILCALRLRTGLTGKVLPRISTS